jgi:putative transcriptional regulator
MPQTIESFETLMTRYVAGALPLPAQVLVAAHLEIKPDNRSLVRSLETLAGDALADAPPIDLTAPGKRLETIFQSPDPVAPTPANPPDELFPRAVRNFVGFGAEDVPWRTKLPGFREYDVGDIDGCHVSLFWIRPGRAIPAHTHGGLELTLVLDGAFNDGNGRYGRGDIALADESVDHRPVTEHGRPCIGLAVTDAPLRLTGPLYQRLTDIIGR